MSAALAPLPAACVAVMAESVRAAMEAEGDVELHRFFSWTGTCVCDSAAPHRAILGIHGLLPGQHITVSLRRGNASGRKKRVEGRGAYMESESSLESIQTP